MACDADDAALTVSGLRQRDRYFAAGDDVGVDRGQRQQFGQLQNFPTRVTVRRLVPVAFTSMVLVVVNVAPQSLMSATPTASSRLGRR